jgi:hypothetical protein
MNKEVEQAYIDGFESLCRTRGCDPVKVAQAARTNVVPQMDADLVNPPIPHSQLFDGSASTNAAPKKVAPMPKKVVKAPAVR